MTARTLPTGLVLATLGLLLGAVLLGSNRLALPWVVGGRSMTPTIQPGDHLIVDLWTYRHRAPRPGELVLFRAPTSSGATLLKRAAVAPPFPDDRPRPGLWPGDGSAREPGVWLLGDNADDSLDSRHFGAVPRDRVVGRVVVRYWPPSRAGSIR